MSDILDRITAKKQQLEQKPLPIELQKNLTEWLMVELTYSSNAIEGNTLTRVETAEVIERGVTAVINGKPLKDQLEAINHNKALNFVRNLANLRKSHQYITEEDIQSIHRIVLTGIDDQWAGKYRQTEVFIRGSNTEFPLPQNIHYAMAEFIQWLETIQDVHPVRLAADTHFKFVNIHPFIDGNGRTARLLMNLILTIHGYPMAVIRNEERTAYLETFNIAHHRKDMQPFYRIVESAAERSLDMYLNALTGKQVMPDFTARQSDLTEKLLRIGELAKATGETIHTLRFWTKHGLLTVTSHTESGYQLYNHQSVKTVREIRRLQHEKRLTVNEIRKQLQKVA